jgi:hypothetical protein
MDLDEYRSDGSVIEQIELQQECYRRALSLRTRIRVLDKKDQIVLIAIVCMLRIAKAKKENFSWLTAEEWESVLDINEYTLLHMEKKLSDLEAALKRTNLFHARHTPRQTYIPMRPKRKVG